MKNTLGIIITEFFQVALVTYLMLLLAENVFPGSVIDFFNLNILLIIVTVSGIIMVLPISEYKWKNKETHDKWLLKSAFKEWNKPKVVKKSPYEWLYVYIVSFGGALLVFYKTKELGNISIAISVLSGLIIWLLSKVVLEEENN